MESLKLRVRVLCAVGFGVAATLSCGDLVPTSGTNGGLAGSSSSDNNPGSSGSNSIPSAGSDSGTSGGSGGADASDAGGGMAGISGAAGSAGASGAGGASGTAGGGASGASGVAGGAGAPVVDNCTHTGPRTKTDLTPTNGRVDCTTNDFGVEGDWKANSSDLPAMSVNLAGSMVCGSGTIDQVVATATSNGQPDFGTYWGGGLALVMHNESPGAPSLPYDATANGLTGISVKITAGTKPIPAQMRFKFKMIGVNDSYCIEVDGATSGQTIVLHTRDAQHNCWMPDTASTLDPTMIENYEVQIVSQTSMAVPFDFCLSEITALSD